MNKKAQNGSIAIIFLLIIFVVNWAIWLGAWISEEGAKIVTENNLTGAEAFAFSNINLIIFFGLILGTMAYVYAGRG